MNSSTVTTPDTQRTAMQTLDCLTGHVAAQENITEAEARRKILRDSPDLRERLRAEANVARPSRGTREREDLREREAAYADSCPTR